MRRPAFYQAVKLSFFFNTLILLIVTTSFREKAIDPVHLLRPNLSMETRSARILDARPCFTIFCDQMGVAK